MHRLLLAAIAAAIATSASATEEVVTVNGVPTIRVSYADLNLRSADDRATLTRRIHSAAEQVCVGTFSQTNIAEPRRDDCYVAAVTRGLAQMNAVAGA